ncbi:MAG: M48 family peptidase, partial [Lysobacteraceae bacterium]
PEWLSTHPDPQNRIRALQQRVPALQAVRDAARQAGRIPRCSN